MKKSMLSILRKSLLLLALLVFAANEAWAFVVVIDAGHGAHDAGAVGKISKEKDLNLSVSLKLGKLIKDNCEDVTVYLTRTTDVFLTLQERADFVNKHNADLFICVHTNSAENKSVRGAETFTLGVDKMASNLNVAMRENSVMLLEEDYQTKYQGFNPQSTESYIMFEFMQDRYIDKSLQFATLVQNQFSDNLHRADRGVRQAGFWVLHKSACPSVLIEMGFISNVEEEKYLASEKGKSEIANAIYKAFVQYKSQLDKKAENVRQASQDQKSQSNDSKAGSGNTKPADQKADSTALSKDSVLLPKPVFRVQIFVVRNPVAENAPQLQGLQGCKYTKAGKFYKYTYGETEDYEEIVEVERKLRQKFADCFIVAFLGDKSIPVREARQMSQKK